MITPLFNQQSRDHGRLRLLLFGDLLLDVTPLLIRAHREGNGNLAGPTALLALSPIAKGGSLLSRFIHRYIPEIH